MYSFGTYTRETDTERCSSISLASLRASSTGCTWVRNARPNTPSTRPSILLSIALRTLMCRVLWRGGDRRRAAGGKHQPGSPTASAPDGRCAAPRATPPEERAWMPRLTQGVSFGGRAPRTVESSCRPERQVSRGVRPSSRDATTGRRGARRAGSSRARPAATTRRHHEEQACELQAASAPRCLRRRGDARTAARPTRGRARARSSAAPRCRASVSARAWTTSVDRSLPGDAEVAHHTARQR